MTAPSRGVYAIYDRTTLDDDALDRVDAVLAAGVRWFQYRDKRNSRPDTALARQLQARCQAVQAEFIINDDWRLAAELGCGVHMGATDGNLATARAALGPHARIGATCGSDIGRAERALAAGADHVSFGRFFASATKPEAPPADPVVLGQAQALGVPVVAIGGIERHNAGQLLTAGADLIAISGALFRAADSTRAAAELVALCAAYSAPEHA